jgi:hypothetical protein
MHESRSRKGRQPVTPTDGAGAVPAGGGSSPPLPGGSGRKPGRQHDRSATKSLDWDRRGRVTPASTLRPRKCAGVERQRWFAAASAAVERRQASRARSVVVWQHAAAWRGGTLEVAPAGVPLPFFRSRRKGTHRWISSAEPSAKARRGAVAIVRPPATSGRRFGAPRCRWLIGS